MSKIYCANCSECRQLVKDGKRFVRCRAKLWMRRTGGREKVYPFKTVLLRRSVSCPAYDSMGGDIQGFVNSLRANIEEEYRSLGPDAAEGMMP